MRLTVHPQRVRPRHRFATSQGGLDHRDTFVVALAHDGLTGYGEVVPSALYGQTLERSADVLAAAAGQLGDDPFALEPIMARLLAAHDDQRAALAGVDAALHDWVGRRLNMPVWRLLGLARPDVETSFTLGVAGLDESAAKLDEALAAGYRVLKIKVGTDADEALLALIRRRFDGELRLDANQAWTAAEAPARLRALQRFGPALIEQPLRREEWPAMRELRALGVAPIIADESCERPADVLRLRGCVDGINIKLTKCGGLREALRMIALARACDMQIMLGCFVSSTLAIAPALHIASLVDHVDLDGHLLLADDPWQGIPPTAGRLTLADQPGLAVTCGTGLHPVRQ